MFSVSLGTTRKLSPHPNSSTMEVSFRSRIIFLCLLCMSLTFSRKIQHRIIDLQAVCLPLGSVAALRRLRVVCQFGRLSAIWEAERRQLLKGPENDDCEPIICGFLEN